MVVVKDNRGRDSITVDSCANNITVQPIVYPWLMEPYYHVKKLVDSEKLPQVLLIHGPKGSGKSNLAMQLAVDILSNDSNSIDLAGVSDSLHLVASDNHIKVDEIRSIIANAYTTSLYNSKKVNIILNIEQLTESAANALLKILESSNPNCLFILTSDNYDGVKSTILSRCYKINITIPKYLDKVYSWLTQQGVTDIIGQNILLELVSCAPLAALNFYKLGYLEKFKQLQIIILGLNDNNIVSFSSEVVELFTINNDKTNKKLNFKIDDFLMITSYLLCKEYCNINSTEKQLDISTNVLQKAIYLINSYEKQISQGLTIDPYSLVYKLLYTLNR